MPKIESGSGEGVKEGVLNEEEAGLLSLTLCEPKGIPKQAKYEQHKKKVISLP